MGSLMAGWDSHGSDPQSTKYRKNKSLTKEEIEAYWRSKKQIEEEHQRYISMLSPQSQKQAKFAFEEAGLSDVSSEESLDQLIKKNGWWISSNWAHLNEPPVREPESGAYKYVSQFHVANMATGSNTKQGQPGINA